MPTNYTYIYAVVNLWTSSCTTTSIFVSSQKLRDFWFYFLLFLNLNCFFFSFDLIYFGLCYCIGVIYLCLSHVLLSFSFISNSFCFLHLGFFLCSPVCYLRASCSSVYWILSHFKLLSKFWIYLYLNYEIWI